MTCTIQFAAAHSRTATRQDRGDARRDRSGEKSAGGPPQRGAESFHALGISYPGRIAPEKPPCKDNEVTTDKLAADLRLVISDAEARCAGREGAAGNQLIVVMSSA